MAAHQAPPFLGLSRQEYWIGLPFPSPGDLPNPGIKPQSPALQVDSLSTELQGKPFVSLGRYIPKYFILFVAMVNGIVALISVFSL